MPVDFDRQRIDVHRRVAHPVPISTRLDPPRRHFQQRLTQHRSVALAAQRADKPRQRRLRGQAVGHLGILVQGSTFLAGPRQQRRDSAPTRHREPHRRVAAQGTGVILVTPALAQQEQRRVEQLRHRVRDQLLIPRIFNSLDQPRRDAEPLDHLAEDHGAGLRGQALGPGLHPQRTVELGRKQHKVFTHDVSLLVRGLHQTTSSLRAFSRHVSLFHPVARLPFGE